MRDHIDERVKQNEERLQSILESSHDGILVEDNEKIIFVNKSYLNLFGYQKAEELIGQHVSVIIASEDAERVLEFGRRRRVGEQPPSEYEFKGRRRDGSSIDVEASVSKSVVGDKIFITTILRDITERKRTQVLIEAQKNSLEMVVAGKSLDLILNYLVKVVENQTDGRSIASILLLDESGRLRNGASPSLPEHYLQAIDGIKADPDIGTCSAAAALGKVVITPDIDADVNWQKLKHLPLELGFQSAWSMPIMAHDGHVLGTFGTYFREKREPSSLELQIVGIFAHTAALAIERRETEEALRRSHDELETRVAERTHELAEANENLKIETDERLLIEAERVNLLKRVVTTQEEERRRIARDMHDHFGQQLTALRLKLELLNSNFNDNRELTKQIGETQTIAAALDSDMSFLVWELRPAALDDLGLGAALANYVRKWSKQFSTPVDLHIGVVDKNYLSAEIETHFYRIAQEALNNIYKHARAKQVSVLLEQNGDDLVMIIEDDGGGFETEEKMNRTNGLGLIGMRERAALIGGKTEIESIPGSGTTVYVRVPVDLITERE